MSHVSESESTRSEAALMVLAGQLGTAVVRPGDEGWDRARTPWNLAVDQRPAAVVTPRDLDEVQLILIAAREGNLNVTVQPNGHGAGGSFDGCILVRTTAFDEVSVDVPSRTARIGAGVKWGAVLPQLDGTGLIAVAGTNPDVTVAGYLLSGGHSWFSRWKGLAAHSIRAVELVDAEGTLHRVTADSDPDLLWALRGAGGLFGIVTALEIELYEAPALYGGKLIFPDALAEIVFGQVAAVMADAPDELSIFAGMINLPDLEMIPPPLRGQTVATADVVFVGTEADGRALLRPLMNAATPLVDLTREFTISQLGEVANEPTQPSPTVDWAGSLPDADVAGLAALIDAFRTGTPAGLTLVQVRPLGGAQADAESAEAGVVGFLEPGYLVFAAAIMMDPTRPIDIPSAFSPLDRAVAGRNGPSIVPSMLAAGSDLTTAFSPASLARLAEIKRRVDPTDVFRSNRALP